MTPVLYAPLLLAFLLRVVFSLNFCDPVSTVLVFQFRFYVHNPERTYTCLAFISVVLVCMWVTATNTNISKPITLFQDSSNWICQQSVLCCPGSRCVFCSWVPVDVLVHAHLLDWPLLNVCLSFSGCSVGTVTVGNIELHSTDDWAQFPTTILRHLLPQSSQLDCTVLWSNYTNWVLKQSNQSCPPDPVARILSNREFHGKLPPTIDVVVTLEAYIRSPQLNLCSLRWQDCSSRPGARRIQSNLFALSTDRPTTELTVFCHFNFNLIDH